MKAGKEERKTVTYASLLIGGNRYKAREEPTFESEAGLIISTLNNAVVCTTWPIPEAKDEYIANGRIKRWVNDVQTALAHIDIYVIALNQFHDRCRDKEK